MADTKISALPSAAPRAGDQIAVVRSGVTSRTSIPVILQTLSTTKTDTFTTTATTAAGRELITGLTATITPSATTSKILVRASVSMGNTSGSALVYASLQRDSTVIATGDAASARATETSAAEISSTAQILVVAPETLDSPSSTSAIVYGVSIWGNAGTTTVNRSGGDADLSGTPRVVSTITVMEIAG